MINMKLLGIKEIRNFIFDTNKKKLLIGSRCTGKTSALLLNLAINSTDRNYPRKSIYVTYSINKIKRDYKILKDICNELEIFISDYREYENGILFEIEYSPIKMMVWNKGDYSLWKHADNYIDEPNSICDFNSLLDKIALETKAYPDAKIIIAGSNIGTSKNLLKLSADLSFSRHVIMLRDYYPAYMFNKLKQNMETIVFEKEIQCKFIDDKGE